MAMQTRTVGQATPIVTCTATEPKRQREPDSMPDESLKKRTREEELSQEPVIQTPESIQREADLRRSLLAARRTTGFAVTVKEGPRSAVVQPSSSAIEEIEISSESANENEATVGEEMMAINEQRGELEHPESSLAEQPSRSEIGDENGEVPLSKGSSPKKQRSGDSSNETDTSTQVAARPFLFCVSPAMEGQTSGTRDIEATDAGQLEEGKGLEVLFEEGAEVSTSGQEASAGDGTEMVDSPASDPEQQVMKVTLEIESLDEEIAELNQKRCLCVQKKEKLIEAANNKKTATLAALNWSSEDYVWSKKLKETMNDLFGISSLRPHQLPTMNASLSGQDVILLLPTGGGKSLCFQLPVVISSGFTLVVSPLVALMEDQIMALKKKNINAEMISASTPKEKVTQFQNVRPKPASHKQCIDELAELLTTKYSGQSGIIYSTSIKDTQKLTKDLRSRGLKVGCYHADLSPEARSKCHQKWISNHYQAVIATIAFGMGMDKPDVRFVIHHSISRSMANFYQESGRAGRDDSPAECILYFRFGDLFRISAMVFAEATGLENLYGMVSYCIDSKRCRRHIIAEHFEEIRESVDCDKMCDHCRYPKTVKLVDITNYTQDLGKVLSNAKAAHQNVTGPKLVDAWLGKGQSNLKVAGLKAPPLERESCEKVVSYLLLEGFLKEDFLPTRYKKISYVLAGPQMNSVISGKRTVTMELPERSLVT
ncbi:ATP-dependent DNA helicase Q1-like isoform X2 [Artemia franciscana]|uniref:ATP-dependent DNA helicase Q1-like isoform X2 n=1 Tax=Artemia franciscana TaxID=6661 RepID=UPI0032DA77B1